MSRTLAPQPLRPITSATAIRLRFGPADGDVLRRYVDPRVAAAVAVRGTGPADAAAAWPEPTDTLDVLVSTDRRPLAADDWLAPPDHPDAPRPLAVRVDAGRVRWRPGRAVLEGPFANGDDVLAGLADFAFYEGELRRLEAALPAFESSAAADAPSAYRIVNDDRYARFGETMERLAAARLTFARLEPRLGRPSPSLAVDGRRAFARLSARAGVEDRLGAVSDRLEACEDLYEGAVDRVTDHRWWRKGHTLESVIVGLLAFEGLQLAVDLFLRWRGH